VGVVVTSKCELTPKDHTPSFVESGVRRKPTGGSWMDTLDARGGVNGSGRARLPNVSTIVHVCYGRRPAART
jgi:hypothetical protein